MTVRNWDGSAADFGRAGDWSPIGGPLAGDTAVISRGTVTVTGSDLASNLIVLLGGAAASPTLAFVDTVIPSSDQIVGVASPYATMLTVSGMVRNDGRITSQPSPSGHFQVLLAGGQNGGATFVNNGEIIILTKDGQFASYSGNPAYQLVNNGRIDVQNPASSKLNNYATTTLHIPLSGTGFIEVEAAARLEIAPLPPPAVFVPVSADQTIVLNGGGGYNAVLTLDSPSSFAGKVSGLNGSGNVVLTSPSYDSREYTTSNGVTTLSFLTRGTVVASLRLVGTYTADQLKFSTTPELDGWVQTSIFGEDQSASGTPPSSESSSGPGAPSQNVYRFFDTSFGTHFFTADANEASAVRSGRSDLVDEGIGLHAVNPAANDPNAAPVYRFFDNVFGTHFFTASASEKDSLVANRPDLTFEPGSTFYEHATEQAGDVPVYRFFDSIHGTHFYTADASERATISATRPDLISEGVGFYAPST